MTIKNIEEASDIKFLKKVARQPSFFAEKFLGINTYYYQKEFLDDPHPHKAVIMGRQMGKSLSLSIAALHQAVIFAGSRVAILAQNERRAFEIYRMVKQILYDSSIAEDIIDPKQDKMSEMILNNGSKISYYASGNEGKSIRGDTLDLLIMDEADFIPDAVYMAALPTVSATNGKILLSSTPYRKYSMFYNIFMDAWEARLKYEGKKPLEEGELPYEAPIGRNFGFKAFHYDYQHGLAVINPRTGKPQTDIRLVELAKRTDYTFFEKEYLAWWSEDTSSFFTEATINGALVAPDYYVPPPRFYVMGLDLGRVNDYTAITILQVAENRRKAVVIDTFRMRKNDWNYQLGIILQFAEKYAVEEIYIDENNVGDVINTWLNNLADGGLNLAIIPKKLSIQSKTVIYNNLKAALNTGTLKIWYTHDELIKELRHLSAEESETNRGLKIHAPTGKHDDLADSLALASQALNTTIGDDEPMAKLEMERKEWNYDDLGDEYSDELFMFNEGWGELIEREVVRPDLSF